MHAHRKYIIFILSLTIIYVKSAATSCDESPPQLVISTNMACNSGPCLNNAGCSHEIMPNGDVNFSNYRCICSPSYTGYNCEVELPCSSSPCENGAECIDNKYLKNHNCICSAGWMGKRCHERQLTTTIVPATVPPTTAAPTTAAPTTVVPTTAAPTTAVPTTTSSTISYMDTLTLDYEQKDQYVTNLASPYTLEKSARGWAGAHIFIGNVINGECYIEFSLDQIYNEDSPIFAPGGVDIGIANYNTRATTLYNNNINSGAIGTYSYIGVSKFSKVGTSEWIFPNEVLHTFGLRFNTQTRLLTHYANHVVASSVVVPLDSYIFFHASFNGLGNIITITKYDCSV